MLRYRSIACSQRPWCEEAAPRTDEDMARQLPPAPPPPSDEDMARQLHQQMNASPRLGRTKSTTGGGGGNGFSAASPPMSPLGRTKPSGGGNGFSVASPPMSPVGNGQTTTSTAAAAAEGGTPGRKHAGPSA